ncbi:MAG: SDR family NAD(P)-dependent oxidoreductase [Candidatus Paceibacteria bacterium]
MDRVVIITGSSRGIGLASAAKFLRHGDRVVIFCRHKNEINNAKEYLSEFGKSDSILSLVGDVRKAKDVAHIVGATLDKFGRVDVLVNNAGIAIYKTIEETTEDEWDDVLATNLKGAYLFCKEVLPAMKKQNSGVIINISSGLGVQGEAKYSAYSASKFGLVGLTQVLADELKNTGIKVYAVLPGAVATKLHLDMHPWEDPSSMMTPEYVAEKIFNLADGKQKSGYLLEVYS